MVNRVALGNYSRAWFRWVWPNPSIFREGILNPKYFWKFSMQALELIYFLFRISNFFLSPRFWTHQAKILTAPLLLLIRISLDDTQLWTLQPYLHYTHSFPAMFVPAWPSKQLQPWVSRCTHTPSELLLSYSSYNLNKWYWSNYFLMITIILRPLIFFR